MKANELMIGGYFRVNRDGLCIKKGTIVRIVGIDGEAKLEEKGLVCAVHCHPLDREQFDGGIWLAYLDPIPLTPEILKKNGITLLEVGDNGVATPAKNRNRYEKWQIHTKWKDTYLWYDRATKRWNLYDMNGAQFTNVHQMQHALLLCEIEKEIEL